MFGGSPCPPLYIWGDRIIWKVLAEYSWSLTTTQSGSFLCTAASSTPIRVVTKKVRYIHELSLTLEHSMSVSSPAAPGLRGWAIDARNSSIGRGTTRAPRTCWQSLALQNKSANVRIPMSFPLGVFQGIESKGYDGSEEVQIR